MDAFDGPYAAGINHYLRAELEYESDLPYAHISEKVSPWSFKDFEGRPIDVSPMLERAMRANPHLRVHVAFGIYDGATPPGASELLNLPSSSTSTYSTGRPPSSPARPAPAPQDTR